jgi:ADP-heptose:LPS heptosyltransferase
LSQKTKIYLFRQEGIAETDKLLAIHPVASCISRIWPADRFAELADRLITRYGFKVFIIAGSEPEHIRISRDVIAKMRYSAINLAGKTSVSQLASLLKRCQLHISSDTGPMHIASSLGIPVIALFGRKQKGLSPKRWGPLGKKSHILHRDVGCIKCLAHNCVKNFTCFKAISVDDVIEAAVSTFRDVF